jgi:short-subunit dehydrogenase
VDVGTSGRCDRTGSVPVDGVWNAGLVPVALVTGPTAGIGRAFATALAAEGHDLVLVSRDKARLEQVSADLSAAYGIACEVLSADLSDAEQTRNVERYLAEHPVDVLVNNAGFGKRLPFEANDIEAEQECFDVLVTAVMRLTHAALGPMRRRGRGDIINVSSVAGFLPRGTYGAHKAWVISFSRWAHLRYRKDGLRVMALCPGFVRTEFHQRMDANLSGIPGFMWLDADRLAGDALEDLRAGKAVSIPSKRWKAVVTVARLAPNRLVERVARRGR